MYIFVHPSRRVELFTFASLLMEYIQYQNVKPILVDHENHGAKGNHSVSYSQRAQSQRDPDRT
jgi:hypothetical protein